MADPFLILFSSFPPSTTSSYFSFSFSFPSFFYNSFSFSNGGLSRKTNVANGRRTNDASPKDDVCLKRHQ